MPWRGEAWRGGAAFVDAASWLVDVVQLPELSVEVKQREMGGRSSRKRSMIEEVACSHPGQ